MYYHSTSLFLRYGFLHPISGAELRTIPMKVEKRGKEAICGTLGSKVLAGGYRRGAYMLYMKLSQRRWDCLLALRKQAIATIVNIALDFDLLLRDDISFPVDNENNSPLYIERSDFAARTTSTCVRYKLN